MEFKGTKGKWEVNSYDETLVIPNVTYTNEGICRCFSRKFTGNKIEDKANALLISKAPEMLEMLKLVSDGISEMDFAQLELILPEIEQLLKEATEI